MGTPLASRRPSFGYRGPLTGGGGGGQPPGENPSAPPQRSPEPKRKLQNRVEGTGRQLELRASVRARLLAACESDHGRRGEVDHVEARQPLDAPPGRRGRAAQGGARVAAPVAVDLVVTRPELR